MSGDDEKPGGLTFDVQLGTVVHLFGPPPAADGVPVVQPRDWRCFKHSAVLDRTARTVTCSACNKSLDAFDLLADVADDFQRWTRLHAECRAMRTEIESLKAEEKRVKARTASHARKDAAAAVDAERERLSRNHFEIACRTDDARRALARIDQLIGRTPIVRHRRQKEEKQ
jgi:ElaB/YqjD/DUF883 family membrane-anchored ribosome-binding protein